MFGNLRGIARFNPPGRAGAGAHARNDALRPVVHARNYRAIPSASSRSLPPSSMKPRRAVVRHAAPFRAPAKDPRRRSPNGDPPSRPHTFPPPTPMKPRGAAVYRPLSSARYLSAGNASRRPPSRLCLLWWPCSDPASASRLFLPPPPPNLA
jgi:hypothetical protein